jgi:hypothetical protein
MTMKKLVLGLAAMFFAAVSIQSCSQGKSDDQIKKEAQDQFEKDKTTTLAQQADANCLKVIDSIYVSIKDANTETEK